MVEFPADEAERVRIFDLSVHEAWRHDVTAIATMRSHIGHAYSYHAEYLAKQWQVRNKPISLRSEGWPEPKRSEVAAQWDDVDRADNVRDRAQARRLAREAINEIRWAVWTLAHLSRPEVVAYIEAGPIEEHLHWRSDGRYRETAIMDAKGNIVAEVIHQRSGVGPTFCAMIYAPPHKPDGSIALYQRGDEAKRPAREELAWGMFRQRKTAAVWMAAELHRRCLGIFGREINLPAKVAV